MLVPHSVGISTVPIISLTATGIPCRMPIGLPDLLWSSASFAFSNKIFLSKNAQAFTSFSNSSILSIYFSHNSTEVNSEFFIFRTRLSTLCENISLIKFFFSQQKVHQEATRLYLEKCTSIPLQK